MENKCLIDFKCNVCHKLLGKGILHDVESVLEVKCRKCGNIQVFTLADAEGILKIPKLNNG